MLGRLAPAEQNDELETAPVKDAAVMNDTVWTDTREEEREYIIKIGLWCSFVRLQRYRYILELVALQGVELQEVTCAISKGWMFLKPFKE